MENRIDKKTKTLPSLIKMLKGLLFTMLLAIVNGTLGFLCSMSITILGVLGLKQIMDNVVYVNFYLLVGLIIGLGLLRGFLRYLEQYQNHYIAFKLLAYIRLKIFNALRKLDQHRLEKMKKGNLISLITSDIEMLEVFYAHTISPIFIAFLTSTTLILCLGFLINWYVALAGFISFIIIGVINPLIQARLIKKAGIKYRTTFSNFNAYFLDSIKGIKELTLYDAVKKRKDKIDKLSSTLIKDTKTINYKNAKNFSITSFLISLLLILNMGFLLYLNHRAIISVGDILFSFSIISGGFGPVIALSNLPSSLNQTFASARRVIDITSAKSDPLLIAKGEKIKGIDCISFNNVSFSYTDNTLLENVSFKAKKGEIIGIIGKSGEGKSTILKLLLRLYKATKGSILYNDVNINNISQESLFDNITLLNQFPYLFQTSIKENIALGNPNASIADIKASIDKAGLTNFINNLENKEDTILDKLANNISQGERQRISIARAFLKNSDVIMLDEPTSNVDAINEGIILNTLIQNKKEHIIIIVSHRQSSISICDKIYKLENNTLVNIK